MIASSDHGGIVLTLDSSTHAEKTHECLREQLVFRQHHGMICFRDARAARQPLGIPIPGGLEPEGLVIPAGDGLFGTHLQAEVQLGGICSGLALIELLEEHLACDAFTQGDPLINGCLGEFEFTRTTPCRYSVMARSMGCRPRPANGQEAEAFPFHTAPVDRGSLRRHSSGSLDHLVLDAAFALTDQKSPPDELHDEAHRRKRSSTNCREIHQA